MYYLALGQNNLNEWASHCCCLGAVSAFILHMMIRLTDKERLRWQFNRKVGLPLTFSIPVMLALLWESPRADQVPSGYFADIPPDGWLAAYWILFCGTLLYLEILLGLLLLRVREDKRSRRLADWYLVAVMYAIVGISVRLVTVAYGDNADARYMWLFGCLSVMTFAGGSAFSLRCKNRWLRKHHVTTVAWNLDRPGMREDSKQQAFRSDPHGHNPGEQLHWNAP
jgi:hypothetical protein